MTERTPRLTALAAGLVPGAVGWATMRTPETIVVEVPVPVAAAPQPEPGPEGRTLDPPGPPTVASWEGPGILADDGTLTLPILRPERGCIRTPPEIDPETHWIPTLIRVEDESGIPYLEETDPRDAARESADRELARRAAEEAARRMREEFERMAPER